MDSLSIDKDIERSLSDIIKTAEDILLLAAGHDELKLKAVVLSPTQDSHLKFRLWQQNWSGATSNPTAAYACWGFQGWRSIEDMLNKILETSDHIGKYLDHISKSPTIKSISKGKTTVTAQLPKQESSEDLKELQKMVTVLITSIDGVWIYSETVFDSLHDIIEHKENLPASENFLTFALQSRAGSLDLHNLCSDSPVHSCLEMDLLNAGSLTCHTSNESKHPYFQRLFYHLFAEAREYPQEIKEMIIENLIELDGSAVDESESASDNIVQSYEADIQLFESQPGTGTKWTVSHHGSDPPAFFFLRPTVGRILLETKPERLAGLLATQGGGTILPMEEHFSLPAKIELAYKVIECGFFLIETPWFSSLSSKNIKRIRCLGQKRPTYMLEVQTLDHHDMLSDHPGALAETSHLFRIGIILMEIALYEPIRSKYLVNNNGHDEEWISRLGLIERSMGSQYCKTTSFCLQYRQPNDRFRGPEKYHGERFVEWQSYLAGFLREYHSQVLLRYAIRADDKYRDKMRALTWCRLQKLRNIQFGKERKPPTSRGRALGILMGKVFKGWSNTARSIS